MLALPLLLPLMMMIMMMIMMMMMMMMMMMTLMAPPMLQRLHPLLPHAFLWRMLLLLVLQCCCSPSMPLRVLSLPAGCPCASTHARRRAFCKAKHMLEHTLGTNAGVRCHTARSAYVHAPLGSQVAVPLSIPPPHMRLALHALCHWHRLHTVISQQQQQQQLQQPHMPLLPPAVHQRPFEHALDTQPMRQAWSQPEQQLVWRLGSAWARGPAGLTLSPEELQRLHAQHAQLSHLLGAQLSASSVLQVRAIV